MNDAKIPKPIVLGKFKPPAAGTSLARICNARPVPAAKPELPLSVGGADLARMGGKEEDAPRADLSVSGELIGSRGDIRGTGGLALLSSKW
jgi:hypothetical protein